jgi:bifunctional UDP-N-acetylglucosamine pyrophosphorylase/glucosamine-1-phosphate N-acetyltransferase
VAIGAGSVLANFRLDEKVIKSRISNEFLDTGKIKLGAAIGENVRIGVNVSIMPGVKIGRDCFLGAGVVLDKDLPDDKYCALKSGQYTVKDNLNGHKNSRREKQRASLRF